MECICNCNGLINFAFCKIYLEKGRKRGGGLSCFYVTSHGYGFFFFDMQVGYSSPAESGILRDLGLSLAQVMRRVSHLLLLLHFI